MYLYGTVVVVDRGIQQRLSPFHSTPLGHSWLLVPSTTLCQYGTSTPASKSAYYLLFSLNDFEKFGHKVLHFVLHLHSFKFLKWWKLWEEKKNYWLRWYKLNVFKKNHILVYIYGLWKRNKDMNEDFFFLDGFIRWLDTKQRSVAPSLTGIVRWLRQGPWTRPAKSGIHPQVKAKSGYKYLLTCISWKWPNIALM